MTRRLAFLKRAGWDRAEVEPLAGDASARHYARVKLKDKRAILMMAPPSERAAFDAFLNMALRLRDVGLSAPDILAARPEDGLILLEDFGDHSFAAPDLTGPEGVIAAVDVLLHLARVAPDWPLVQLTPQKMAKMTEIALPDGPQTRAAVACMTGHFDQHLTRPLIPALRDYHAENLMWLPDRVGVARVGLLDFQDAVLAPPGYDLISFTHDARRDTAPQMRAAAITHYAQAMNIEAEVFATECALLIFQRNLRILGVFRRLARDRGKPAYLTHLPRVFRYVEIALQHPALAKLQRAMMPLMAEVSP